MGYWGAGVFGRVVTWSRSKGECYKTYATIDISRGNITWRLRSEAALSTSLGARECSG